MAQVSSLLGKGEAVVLTRHRRAGKSCIYSCLNNPNNWHFKNK
jgi:hypothetical protein